jgi:hypothetical protein
MKLKTGIKIAGLKPELMLGMIVADGIAQREFGKELTITSVVDGVHMKGSKHYLGMAADFRTYDMQPGQAVSLTKRLKESLDEWFDIVQESDHIHFEYDPH